MEQSAAEQPTLKEHKAIFPIAYFPPVYLFQLMLKHKPVVFEQYEHFHKQFYYNRCLIAGPNGLQKLSIPIIHKHKRSAIKDVKIAYKHNWRALHWRSLESAYRRSPYFEYYEHHFAPLFETFTPDFLLDWNQKLFDILNSVLRLDSEVSFTSEYLENYTDCTDYRKLASPAILSEAAPLQPEYLQVFKERNGFLPNISIIDLLFCEGPHALDYLKTA
jgi:WbqC-like protein family